MTDTEFQDACDARSKALLDSIADMDRILRLVVLTGCLAALAHAEGMSRAQVLAAINSVFDDIEAGEIPGQVLQ